MGGHLGIPLERALRRSAHVGSARVRWNHVQEQAGSTAVGRGFRVEDMPFPEDLVERMNAKRALV